MGSIMALFMYRVLYEAKEHPHQLPQEKEAQADLVIAHIDYVEFIAHKPCWSKHELKWLLIITTSK
jgi:hypothetical protein